MVSQKLDSTGHSIIMLIVLYIGIFLGVVKAIIEMKEKQNPILTTTNLLEYIFDTKY